MNDESKIKQIEDELEFLRTELDKQDNNPQKSIEIRKKIAILVKKLEDEKGNKIVSPEQGKDLFAQMKQDVASENIFKYRDFFN